MQGETHLSSGGDAVNSVNCAITALLTPHGFHQDQEGGRWLRARSGELWDRLVVVYGKKHFPANLSCSPMISVFSRQLTDEVKLRFGARFSKNDFGALSLGCVMPEGRFKSWNLMAGVKVDQLAQSIVQAFLRYGLPVIEEVTSLGAMRTYLEVKRVESGDHNELLDLIAPSCLAYLEGDNDACTRYLERMLVLDSRLANGDAWAAKFRPSRERIAKFLQAVRVSGQ